MRFLLWTSLISVGVLGFLVPLMYWHEAAAVPALETSFDLDRFYGDALESDQLLAAAGQTDKRARVKYERPSLGDFPLELVSLYLMNLGCPSYLQTPREEGWRWHWRIFSAFLFAHQPAGDGHCEWILAQHLAGSLNIDRAGARAIASNRIHALLPKDRLVAYDLATQSFEVGVKGAHQASLALFRKPIHALRLAHLAELSLALPPYDFYAEVKACNNTTLLRQNRDTLLERLAAAGLLSKERTRAAQGQPLGCVAPSTR